MKFAATILLFIIGFLTIQPVLPVPQKKKATSSCAKKRCSKPVPTEKKKNCEEMVCNPFWACPYYNIFFNEKTSSPALASVKEKIFVRNDNRTIQTNKECWHPPDV